MEGAALPVCFLSWVLGNCDIFIIKYPHKHLGVGQDLRAQPLPLISQHVATEPPLWLPTTRAVLRGPAAVGAV